MILTPNIIGRQSINRLLLTAISLCALLVFSGCSSDDTVAEESVVTSEETAVARDTDSTISDNAISDNDQSAPAAAVETLEAPIAASTTSTETSTEGLAVDAGATLYEAQCKVCHDKGLLNAPKYGDKTAWAAAMAKDKETLYSHSIGGFNKMPPQAVNGVSEAQVKAAVDYILVSVS